MTSSPPPISPVSATRAQACQPSTPSATGSATPGAPLRILFVGHWRDSRKGLPHLLDACERLTARGVAWTLDIVGDGGTQAKSTLPGITYHGPISSERQVAELYASCDVFASPAVGGESFGIVLLEAMASARPIVCSDIAGYRYAVGGGPDCGAKLVAPGDVDGLAEAFAALAADPALRARLEPKPLSARSRPSDATPVVAAEDGRLGLPLAPAE